MNATCGPAAPGCAAAVAGANAVATADAYGASPGEALQYGLKAGVSTYAMAVAGGGNRGGNAYGGNWFETSLIMATVSGVSSSIHGQSFRSGFERGGIYALAGELYKDMLKRGINAGEVQSETASVHPTEIPFATQSPGGTMKALSISDWRTAQFGLSSSLSNALTSMSETALQWIPKNVPFAHPISVHHDLWNGLLIQKYGKQVFTYSNVPTMFGSAALTVASFGNTIDIDGYSSYERR